MQLVPMKFSLLEGLDSTKRYPIKVSFHHNLLTYRLREPKYMHERLHHVLHGVPVVIVEQDLVEREAHRVLVENSSRFCGRKYFGHITAQ